MLTQTITSTSPEIKLDYLSAARLMLPQVQRIQMALVGCGGTGSWLAPSVARVARLLVEKFNKRVSVMFIDPDRVEAKNVYRQNFCQAEIGRYKGDCLAYRYGLAWGIDVAAVCEPVRSLGYLQDGIRVLVGCVDNAAARRSIERLADDGRTWWLDCGNHRSSGQVLLGCGSRSKDPFSLPGYCSWLPSPSLQAPELVSEDDPPVQSADTCDLSCADLALLDSQSLSINQRIAAEAGDYLVRMLLTRDLQKYATYLDLGSGSARSEYITEANIRRYLK